MPILEEVIGDGRTLVYSRLREEVRAEDITASRTGAGRGEFFEHLAEPGVVLRINQEDFGADARSDPIDRTGRFGTNPIARVIIGVADRVNRLAVACLPGGFGPDQPVLQVVGVNDRFRSWARGG